MVKLILLILFQIILRRYDPWKKKSYIKSHVKGRVQGVVFRYSTLREARRLGICGFVRNMPDGTVYIEAKHHLMFLKRIW
jgi:acylphosphatase